MNYLHIYWSIIHNRLHNKVDGYVEHHHIIPRSEGGPDNNDNIVALTAREHYICHLLLAKIYNDDKMWYAVYCMTWRGPKHNRKFKTNSKLYESIKLKCSKLKSETFSGDGNGMYGKHHSAESKAKLSQTRKERIASGEIVISKVNMTDEVKTKLSDKAKERYKDKTNHPMYGRKQSEETRKKISEENKGKTPWNKGKKCGHMSSEQKKKLSAASSGKNNAMYGSKFIWANDGIRNYRLPLDKTLPDNMKFGFIRNKKSSGN